jgi:hypothetical protein
VDDLRTDKDKDAGGSAEAPRQIQERSSAPTVDDVTGGSAQQADPQTDDDSTRRS